MRKSPIEDKIPLWKMPKTTSGIQLSELAREYATSVRGGDSRWGGGMSLDGFNPSVTFNDSLGGYQSAFYLDNGATVFRSITILRTPSSDSGTER